MSASRFRAILLVVLLLAFGLRVVGLNAQSLWRDEVDSIRFASRPLKAALAIFTVAGENGPLYYLMLKFWIALAGRSEVAIRFFSVLWGTAAIAIVALIGQRLLGRSGGLLLALLMTTSPYLIWYSQEARMYSLVLALTLLSSALYGLLLTHNGVASWAGYVMVTSACFYTHVLSAFLVPVHFVTGLLYWPQFRLRWRVWLPAFACLILPYLPLAGWQLRTLIRSFQTGHLFVPLEQMLVSLLVGWTVGIQGRIGWVSLTGVVFLILAALIWPHKIGKGRKNLEELGMARGNSRESKENRDIKHLLAVGVRLVQERRAALAMILYVALPVVGVFLVSLRVPLFTDRYLIWTAPAFYGLLAAGLVAVGQRSKGVAAISLAILLTTHAQSWWTQSHTAIKADFRAAAAFVLAAEQPNDLILFNMPYIQYNFDYYHPRAYSGAGSPCPAHSTPQEAVSALLQLTASRRRIWLVSSEREFCDPTGLVTGWLAEHAREVKRATFQRVEVTCYELGP